MPHTTLFEPLPTPQEMAAWDAMAMKDFGIPDPVLMENAGRECFDLLHNLAGGVSGKTAVVMAGPGNNGGDGFVVARYLADYGARVLVLHSKPRSAYKGAPGLYLRLAARTSAKLAFLPRQNPALLERPQIVVDALLGTGFSGELRQEFLGYVQRINAWREQGSLVLAVDIPSGLNGLTGRPSPVAVRAHATATFEAAKLGLAMPEAAPWLGRLVVRRIGIPAVVKNAAPAACHLMTAQGVRRLMLGRPGLDPEEAPAMHKGTASHVLVIGGSTGLTGAPVLSALGALRSGAGLATVACPGGLAAELKAGFPEIMTLALGKANTLEPGQAQALAKDVAPGNKYDAVVLGPGLGTSPEAQAFLKEFLALERTPTVLDADALNCLALNPDLWKLLGPDHVITPHPGEMARLMSPDKPDNAAVQADRLGAARSLARERGVVVVLKGAATVIASPGGHVLLSPFAEPNLAVAGSGDVLAGVLGRLLAGKLPALDAACLAVYLHGFCGRLLAEKYPARGNLAREIADTLPRAMAASIATAESRKEPTHA